MDALVTDAQLRYALPALRALSAGGVPAVALGRGRASAGLWSRRAAGRETGPDAQRDPAGFVAKVAEIAARRGPLVVYPVFEQSIDALLAHRAALPAEARVPYGSADALRRLRDKRELAALGAEVGLDAPLTLASGTARELAELAPPDGCVVKPLGAHGALESAVVVDSAAEAASLLRGLPEEDPLLLQEHVRGTLIGLALVLDREGTVVARFQQAALRTWPVRAGGSSLAVSVAPDEDLVERAAALLRAAGHWGLAHLQFLEAGRRRLLIDVNPRFYGSMSLALASGVNLAKAWHAVAAGGEPPPVRPYRSGVHYRWLEGELTAAYNGNARILLSRPPRPRVGSTWAADDPLPSAILAAEAGWAPVARRLGLATATARARLASRA